LSYIIGSFNMQKWGGNNSKDYDMLKKIIETENFDIVAFQEVFSDDPIQAICRSLKGTWEYCVGYPEKSQGGEGYAFIWKARRISLAKSRKNNNPQIVEKYKVKRDLDILGLRRAPYYARFTPKALPNMEIRLINTHIRFNKVKSDDISRSDQRYQEFRILAEDIMARISNQPEFNKDFYTVLLGDYNLTLVQIREKGQITVESRSGQKLKEITTAQELPTSLSNDDNTKIIYANNYDHFTYNTENFERLCSFDIERIDAVNKYFDNDREAYKTKISDHVPIKLTIRLK